MHVSTDLMISTEFYSFSDYWCLFCRIFLTSVVYFVQSSFQLILHTYLCVFFVDKCTDCITQFLQSTNQLFLQWFSAFFVDNCEHCIAQFLQSSIQLFLQWFSAFFVDNCAHCIAQFLQSSLVCSRKLCRHRRAEGLSSDRHVL